MFRALVFAAAVVATQTPAGGMLPARDPMDKAPVKPRVPAGETWEAFLIGGKKVGFTRRVTVLDQRSNEATTSFTLAFATEGQTLRFRNTLRFANEAGFRWKSYRFEMPDGRVVEVSFDGKRITGNTAGGKVDQPVAADTVPTYGLYPSIIHLPFEKGSFIEMTAMEDASCELLPHTRLVSVGWENVRIGASSVKLWRVEETTGGKRGNTYWLDEQRRLRKADWQGAESIWVESKAEALSGLPQEVARLAD